MPEFQINKTDFHQHRLVAADTRSAETPLSPGEILVRVDRFAVTANTLTYAVTGEVLGYWRFFPPAGDDAQRWGILPVWGFAEVIASAAPGMPVGERLFGYFAPVSTLKMVPTRISAQRFSDGAPHRAALPPGYNVYTRVEAEPGYDPALDQARMLLWPLHITSFCLADLLKSQDWYGARQIIITSASAKTSIGLAHGLAADPAAPTVIGLTSGRNAAYVRDLALYDRVATYDAPAAIDPSQPTVIVDLAGNAALVAALQDHLGPHLVRVIQVGFTHWEAGPAAQPGKPHHDLFFAPAQIQKRMAEWGPEVFAARSGAFLRETAIKSLASLTFVRVAGLEGLADLYPDLAAGRIAPDQGLIVHL